MKKNYTKEYLPNISFSLGENCSSPLLALARASTQLD